MSNIRRTRLSTILGDRPDITMAMDRWYYVIQRSSNLYLPVGDENDDLARRFASVFRDAWQSLPLAVRRRLVTFWRNDFWKHTTKGFSPQIEIVSGWSNRQAEDIAAFFLVGHGIKFFSQDIRLMPDAIVADTVIHELAHIWLVAVGEHDLQDPNQDPEYLADFTMEEWGFDSCSVSNWWDEHPKPACT